MTKNVKAISDYKPSKRPRVVPLVLKGTDMQIPVWVQKTWNPKLILKDIGVFDKTKQLNAGVLLDAIGVFDKPKRPYAGVLLTSIGKFDKMKPYTGVLLESID